MILISLHISPRYCLIDSINCMTFTGGLTGGLNGTIFERLWDDIGTILGRFACLERPDTYRNVPNLFPGGLTICSIDLFKYKL